MRDDIICKHAVKELIDRYSDAVTRRDFECVASLFGDDAVWEAGAPFNLRLEGAAIAQGLAAALAPFELLLQAAINSVIEVDGGLARARTMIYEMGRQAAGSFVQFGIYEDVVEQSAGGWRFSLRRFHPLYRDAAPLAGAAFGLQLLHEPTGA